MTSPAQQLAEALAQLPAKRKYGNKPIEVDNILFASRKEARRFADLRLMERAGQIKDLKVHPAFPLDVNGHPVCRYTADFSYVTTATETRVVEDVKSPATRRETAYRIRFRLFRAIHGFEITEV